ncbi:MAG TPA: glycosyltransferase family 2 protein [Patescibacteria group bacterium]|nr:glycosyltransferase family 2 protein [Patescibacteria group bacterium]
MIVAVIPAHDEAPRIEAVVRAAREHLAVIVVDDGSGDATAERARGAGATVIEQRPNQGKGAALRTGFRRALDDGAEAILTLDADGQHDPSEIPRFLAAWTAAPAGRGSRPDLVVGRRNFRAMPPVRRLSNELGRRAFSWAVGRDIPDNQSGYRLVSARLAAATLSSAEQGFAFEVEQITTCLRIGGEIAWVPIRTIYAGAPSHVKPIAHLREFIRIVRRAHRDVREPLRPDPAGLGARHGDAPATGRGIDPDSVTTE